MLKRTVILTVAFVFIASIAMAEMMCAIIHMHTKCSDGKLDSTMKRMVEITKSAGCKVAVITDHGDSMLGTDCYAKQIEEAKEYTKNGFFVIIGREITVGNSDKKNIFGQYNDNPNHLNAIAYAPKPDDYKYDPQFDKNQIGAVLDILEKEGKGDRATIVYLNHPNIGKNPLWKKVVRRFDCIEMFNFDFGNLAENPLTKFNYDRDVYLEQGICTIGGLDEHVPGFQEKITKNRTYFYVNSAKPTYDDIFQALRRNTIAAREIEILDFNYPPQTNYYEVGDSFEIKARVKIPLIPHVFKTNLYKYGAKYKKSELKHDSKDIKEVWNLSFSETLAPGKEACYIVEIDQFMMTSAICFRNLSSIPSFPKTEDEPVPEPITNPTPDPPEKPKPDPTPVPPKPKPTPQPEVKIPMPTTKQLRALRIAHVEIKQGFVIDFTTENEPLFESFGNYVICHKDKLIMSPQNQISGCKERLFVRALNSRGKEFYIRDDYGNCGIQTVDQRWSTEQCAILLREAYVIRIDQNDYRAVEYDSYGHRFLLVTGDRTVNDDYKFKVCSSDEQFRFDSSGRIIDCEGDYHAIINGQARESLFPNLAFPDTYFMLTSNYYILIRESGGW